MNNYFGYIRVSTKKQAQEGVSLEEQKDAMQRYAVQKGLSIVRWFVETQTASKAGRPLFNEMVSLLKKREAVGVVMHKVDRSARNYNDWAEIAALLRDGIGVHFATEAFDLTTLGGMLAADMQAVMAVHYSRNLSNEVQKGYYGRLKQGLCPFQAPLGYIDNGVGGKVKTIDPIKGPLVKKAFQLYSKGGYSYVTLADELYRLGLRNKSNRKVTATVLAEMLGNPFYIGLIRIKKTNQIFYGIHQPLISKDLFDQIRLVATGKYNTGPQRHTFIFSRLIRCKSCRRSLIAEQHKGHTYYRCHTRTCPSVSFREEHIESALLANFNKLKLSSAEQEYLDRIIEAQRGSFAIEQRNVIAGLQNRISLVGERLNRLTDAFLDGAIERDIYEQRKTALIVERRECEQRVLAFRQGEISIAASLNKNVELIKTAYSLYKSGNYEDKREIIKSVMSNCTAGRKSLVFTMDFPFCMLAQRRVVQFGGPHALNPRKFWKGLLAEIVGALQKGMTNDNRSVA